MSVFVAGGAGPVINLLRLRLSGLRTADLPAARERDDDFFESLVEDHYRRVYTLIYRIVHNEADAADLTQETFVRVYRALPRLRAEGASATWIRRIATNLSLDFLRRRKAAPQCTSLDAPTSDDAEPVQARDVADRSADPEKLLAGEERTQVLRRAVASLPDDYRAVIVLHHMEEMRVEEIAAVLGVPEGTVKSRLSRARKALFRKLAPYFDPELAR
jgi:RNA polymerase sigma-70 factor (ECF subfamily)